LFGSINVLLYICRTYWKYIVWREKLINIKLKEKPLLYFLNIHSRCSRFIPEDFTFYATMRLQQAVILNSRLYSHLFDEGQDELIAVYSLLRFYKRGNIKYYNEGKLSGYNLLHKKTNLSLTTLKRYVPKLVGLGLCWFDKHNQLVLLGTNKINKLYKKGRTKYVPIEIDTYKQTKLFSFRVRILKMEQGQKSRIDRRSEQNKIIEKMKKGYNLTAQEFKFRNAWRDADKDYARNQDTYNANTVLSNQGFSRLKFGETTSKGSGNYWKKQLVAAGIIKVKRQFQFLKKCSQKEYLSLRYAGDRALVFKNGKLYRELISKFTTTEFYKAKEELKKLKHLSFDFCFFLSKQ